MWCSGSSPTTGSFSRPYNALTVRSPQNWIALGVYVGGRAHRVPGRGQPAERPGGGVAPQRRVRPPVRAVPGPDRRPHARSAGQPHRHRGAGGVRADVDRARPPRGRASRRAARWPQPPANRSAATSRVADLGWRPDASIGFGAGAAPARVSLALVVSNRPVGMLVLRDVHLARAGPPPARHVRQPGGVGRRRAQASRAGVAGPAARGGRPLAQRPHGCRLARPTDAACLHQDGGVQPAPGRRPARTRRTVPSCSSSIELQTDRLARLVSNLLDMTRIEAGALELRPARVMPSRSWWTRRSRPSVGSWRRAASSCTRRRTTPLLVIDHVLITQVLANLLENAERLSPDRHGHPGRRAGRARLRARHGRDRRGRRRARASRPRTESESSRCSARTAGAAAPASGLAIAKAFVEAHGGAHPHRPRGDPRRPRRLHRSRAGRPPRRRSEAGRDQGARGRRRPRLAQGSAHRA